MIIFTELYILILVQMNLTFSHGQTYTKQLRLVCSFYLANCLINYDEIWLAVDAYWANGASSF